jgi:hypothetical protein
LFAGGFEKNGIGLTTRLSNSPEIITEKNAAQK